jgi:hypothetical protein
MIKIHNENQYGFSIKTSTGKFEAILRMPTGQDIIWLNDNDLDFTKTRTFTLLYNKLLVKQSEDLLELDAADFSLVCTRIQKPFLEKSLVSPGTLLEVIYFISGKKFTPDWRLWLEEPIEMLLDMLEVVKQYPPSI